MKKLLIAIAGIALFACNPNKAGNSEYVYGGKSFKIVWAGYEERPNGDLRLIFSPTVPVSNNVAALDRRIEVYIPKGGFDIEFNLATNRMDADRRTTGWLIYYIDKGAGLNLEGAETNIDADDITSGSLLVFQNKVDHKYRITLSAKFTNGKSLSLNFNNKAKDATAILEMSEGTGHMQLQNFEQINPIVWGGFTQHNGTTTITLCNTVPHRNNNLSETMGGVFVLDIPDKYMNNDINTPGGGYDPEKRGPWRFVYNGFSASQTRYGCESGGEYPDDTMMGIISVSRTEGTNRFKLSMNVQFTDYSALVGEYEGTLLDIEALGLPLTMW